MLSTVDSAANDSKSGSKSQKTIGLNCRKLHEFDFLYHSVNLTFNQKEVYTTKIGTVCSIISILFLGLIFYTRTVKMFAREDPYFAMVKSLYGGETIDLWALDFMFAIEAVDPRLGRLEVVQVHSGAVSDAPDGQNVRIETPIKMTECGELFE